MGLLEHFREHLLHLPCELPPQLVFAVRMIGLWVNEESILVNFDDYSHMLHDFTFVVHFDNLITHMDLVPIEISIRVYLLHVIFLLLFFIFVVVI